MPATDSLIVLVVLLGGAGVFGWWLAGTLSGRSGGTRPPWFSRPGDRITLDPRDLDYRPEEVSTEVIRDRRKDDCRVGDGHRGEDRRKPETQDIYAELAGEEKT